MKAASVNNVDIISLLVKYGAEMNIGDNKVNVMHCNQSKVIS
jgi:hypothetical protein